MQARRIYLSSPNLPAVASLPPQDLAVLTEAERSCLRRYVDCLLATIGSGLREVIVFGSVARGESWPKGIPIRSDLDLVVVTESPLPDSLTSELIDATLPLFLECGRQIGPQFRTTEQLNADDEGAAAFLKNVKHDGVCIYTRAPMLG